MKAKQYTGFIHVTKQFWENDETKLITIGYLAQSRVDFVTSEPVPSRETIKLICKHENFSPTNRRQYVLNLKKEFISCNKAFRFTVELVDKLKGFQVIPSKQIEFRKEIS